MTSPDAPPTLLPLRDRIVDAFERQHRDLPWRHSADPYRVWISEMMLQQTRVDTVIDYYHRWMERFPDLPTLARASEHDVLTLWQGLGYYNRARNLLRCARIVARDHNGQLPADPDTLRTLPGIGPYTAGAIASIAYGRPAPIVDGNVQRVLARTLDIDSPLGSPHANRTFWHLATHWANHPDPSTANQALMEFGATTCTPRRPACDTCPAADLCLARARNTVASRPVPRPRTPPRIEPLTAWLLHDPHTHHLLLVRHPDRRRFAGLWAPPLAPGHDDPHHTLFATTFGAPLPPGSPQPAEPVRHLLTHRDLRARVLLLPIRLDSASPLLDALHASLGRENVAWTTIDAVPLSRFAHRIAERRVPPPDPESH